MAKSSIFDMIGPVMIGPSSSHTAGVVRIGRVARWLLGSDIEKAEIVFHNSFARTYEGHGSDKAIISGLMNFKTDDKRIKNALQIAKEAGLEWKFKSVMSASALHPNSIRIHAYSGEKEVEILAISRGGGLISVKEVNKCETNFTAQMHTLILTADDVPGSISFITSILSQEECNIATMTVSRKAKNHIAILALEIDHAPSAVSVEYLNHLKWVHDVKYLPDIDL